MVFVALAFGIFCAALLGWCWHNMVRFQTVKLHGGQWPVVQKGWTPFIVGVVVVGMLIGAYLLYGVILPGIAERPIMP